MPNVVQNNIIDFYENRLKTGYLIIMAGQSNATDRFTISGNLNPLCEGTQTNIMTFYKTANTSASNGSWVKANAGVNTTTGGGVAGNYGIGLCIAHCINNDHGKAAWIVPTAVGGTALANAETTSWNVSHNTGVYAQDLYLRFLNHVTQAIAAIPVGYTLTPIVVWVHQETDSGTQSYANAYQVNFQNFINQARIDLSLPNLKFLITALRNDFDPTSLYSSTVRTAVNNVIAATANTALFDTNNSLYTLSADLTHYNPTSASYVGTQSAWNLGHSLGDLISTY